MSGSVALLRQSYPTYTPDQIKDMLRSTATTLSSANALAQGQGVVNVNNAYFATPTTVAQSFTPSTGTGTLEGARGSVHLVLNKVTLSGEKDINGLAFNAAAMASAEAACTSWNGGTWNGSAWAGSAWAGKAWADDNWS